MATGMEQFQAAARRWGRRARVIAVEWGGRGRVWALALYARKRAHLMTLSPVRRVLLLGLWSFLALLALLIAYMLLLIPLTPSIHDLRQARAAAPSTMVSADGKELARFDQGLQERVTLSQISPNVVSALIATEDRRFYEHHGIDFKRTAGAMLHSLKGDAQGGSTITQQLARNMFPEEIGRSRNLNRKLKELITALKIEATYSKTDILEAYLNTVPFLYNTYGIEMAARTYFDKPAARLDILESATLVGMLKGPNYYNPVGNPERSLQRRNVVLGQMRKHDVIDEARYKQLIKRPLRLHFERQSERAQSDSHFTAYVRKWLIDWADENDYNLELDGLVVHTTLDYGLQQAAEHAVERQANALQAIADVEWSRAGMPSSTSTGMYTSMQAGSPAFEYFWKSHPALEDAVVRESTEYRKAVADGAAAGDALASLKKTAALWRPCINPRRGCKRALWPWTPPQALCVPGWAAATLRMNNSITWHRRRASPVLPLSPSCMVRRWKRASAPTMSTAMQ